MKFLDFMVKAVFISTFMFTAITVFIAYKLLWEQVMITLVERWFTVMVGELIVMGFIQIVKTIVQTKMDKGAKDEH
jgi:hypothetical protein